MVASSTLLSPCPRPGPCSAKARTEDAAGVWPKAAFHTVAWLPPLWGDGALLSVQRLRRRPRGTLPGVLRQGLLQVVRRLLLGPLMDQ
jgi:hypothetical protein